MIGPAVTYWHTDYDRPVIPSAPRVSALLDSRFIRFELPAAHASNLLVELERRGVDGVTLFPGLHGFAATAADFAEGVLARSGREEEPRDSDDDALEIA